MAAKTVLCEKTLSSYNTALYTTELFYEQEATWLSFPTTLGLPQEIQGRNDDYAGCSL